MGKILVTGGAGFIGSHVVDECISRGYKVVVVDDLSTGNINNLPKSDLLEFYEMDIRSEQIEAIFKREKIDYCVHLAAQTSVANGELNPYWDAEMNILSSIKLLSLCEKYGVNKFIASSSAAVYGTPKYLPINEYHTTLPISHYGLSKIVMEKYIQLSHIPYIIFRFANVYGPRQASSKESGVVAIFHDAMSKSEPINIFGDGEQIRDFVFVKDIAKGVVASIESNIENEILNFSSNTGIKINELFKLMKDLYQYKQDAIYLPPRAGDIKNSVLSNEKAMQLLSNLKSTTLEDGLKMLRDEALACIN